MEKVIKLPKSGADVTLRDPMDLRQKDREKIWSLMDADSNQFVQAASTISALMSVIIKSWTLDLIIPSVQFKSLGELHMDDYDFLAEATQEYQKIIFPSFSAGEDNPDSPLDNSNA
jgi:hypothetical protein